MDHAAVLLELIRDYIACAGFMCTALKVEFSIGEQPLLEGFRQKRIPKTGTLMNGASFNFHGGGCCFEFENGIIDIDFGPAGRWNGFDQYRLYEYLSSSEIKSGTAHRHNKDVVQ